MKLPNILTISRLLLIPVMVLAFYLPNKFGYYTAAVIFLLAAITDWLDGYLARRYNSVTKFGTFLDPVADKLVVILALVLLVGSFNHIYLTLPALVIVGREFLISALREWMAEMGKRTSVAVGGIGKVKTTLQMVAIAFLLIYHQGMSLLWWNIGIILLYGAVVLTLWSMTIYLKAAWSDLTFSR